LSGIEPHWGWQLNMENDVARMMAVDEMIERIIVVYFFVGG